jgi:hypothetical protein
MSSAPVTRLQLAALVGSATTAMPKPTRVLSFIDGFSGTTADLGRRGERNDETLLQGYQQRQGFSNRRSGSGAGGGNAMTAVEQRATLKALMLYPRPHPPTFPCPGRHEMH